MADVFGIGQDIVALVQSRELPFREHRLVLHDVILLRVQIVLASMIAQLFNPIDTGQQLVLEGNVRKMRRRAVLDHGSQVLAFEVFGFFVQGVRAQEARLGGVFGADGVLGLDELGDVLVGDGFFEDFVVVKGDVGLQAEGVASGIYWVRFFGGFGLRMVVYIVGK